MDEASSPGIEGQTKVSLYFLFIGLVVLLLDQLSKGWVYSHLPVIDASNYWYPYGGIPIFKNFAGIEFSINHMTNTGAAWGMFGNYQHFLIFLRMGLIVGLLIYLFYFNQHFSWQLPLIFIIAGAIGNVLDFFIYDHVIDMFHFVLWGYDFPVFNIADSAIFLGIASLFFLSFIHRNHPTQDSGAREV